jgi:hypothetical protein
MNKRVEPLRGERREVELFGREMPGMLREAPPADRSALKPSTSTHVVELGRSPRVLKTDRAATAQVVSPGSKSGTHSD